MKYDEMRAMEKTHVCAECSGELVTTWDGVLQDYYLACGRDKHHNGYQQRLSPTQALKRGEFDKVAGKGAQKDLEDRAKRSETALNLLPKADVATGQALGIAKIGELVLWGARIGLNAHLGHVCLYFGKPYVTIDGYYYLMSKEPTQLTVGTRPFNSNERKSYQIADGDYAWIAEAWLARDKLQTVGIGIVTQDEIEGKSIRHPDEFRAPVVHDHPQRMAEKRAEWQLFRKLIPLEVKE